MSLMAGEVAATLLSRAAVPVLYFLLARHGRAEVLQRQGAIAAEAAVASRQRSGNQASLVAISGGGRAR